MTRARHRLQMWTRSRLLLIGLAAVAVLFIVGGSVWAQLGQQAARQQTGVVEQQRDAAAEQRDAAAGQAQSLAEQIKAECADGSLQGPVCEQAAAVAETPVPPVPGPIGPTGPGPTVEQIQAAVDAYLLAHPPPPGRAPTAAEVAAAVASYLTANPPTPGRAPTAEEIASAVERYFADNPPPEGEPGQDGRDGRDGQDGRPPTAAEIRTAVDQYLAANPPPAGPAGKDGQPGPAGEPPSTFTMLLDGQTQTCTRSNADDTAPTYTCSAPAGPGENEPDGGTTTPPESEETP